MPSHLQFFVDEDCIGLGKRLAQRRPGVVWPGHRRLPQVPRETADDVWLPTIGELGLVVITRDRHLRTRHLEPILWARHRVRGFVLTGRGSQSTSTSLHILDTRWRDIEEIIRTQPRGPWMFRVTKSGLVESDLA